MDTMTFYTWFEVDWTWQQGVRLFFQMQNKIKFDKFVGFRNIVSLYYHHSYEDSFTNLGSVDYDQSGCYLVNFAISDSFKTIDRNFWYN